MPSPDRGPDRDEPSSSRALRWNDLAIAAALGWLAHRLYQGSAPAVVNLDGLGYLKLLPHNFAAGHLLFMPMLRAAARLHPGDGLAAGRALSAAAGAISVSLLYLTSRSFVDRGAAALAASGMAVSYGLWVQGSDVEAYACALAALMILFAVALVYRARPSTEGAIALAVALATAVLVHLTHVLASPFVVAWVWHHAPSRRQAIAHTAAALGVGGCLVIGAYAYAAFGVRHTDLAGALRWIVTSGHGFRYNGNVLARVADSVYGLAKAFVWSPYLYESNAQRLLGQFLLGLCAAGFLIGVVALRRRELPSLPTMPLVAWMVPYAAMALLFFGSDHERWLFVLPPLWLLAASAIFTLRHARFTGVLLVAALALINRTTAIAPAMTETWDRTRAEAAGALLHDGDLVLFPGHAWDEYVWLYGGHDIHPLPLAYYAGLLGAEGCLGRVDKEMGEARAAGAHIYALRLLDDDGDTRGRYELTTLGLGPDSLREYFTRFSPRAVATSEPKVTLYELR